MSDGVRAERLPDVGVQIDSQGVQCTKQKGIALLRCPFARLSGSPSNLRRPAVIRQAIRQDISQCVCLRKTFENLRYVAIRWELSITTLLVELQNRQRVGGDNLQNEDKANNQ